MGSSSLTHVKEAEGKSDTDFVRLNSFYRREPTQENPMNKPSSTGVIFP